MLYTIQQILWPNTNYNSICIMYIVTMGTVMLYTDWDS